MKYALRITDTAYDDLAEIWLYIASESTEDIATRYVSRLQDAMMALCDTPGIGSPRNALANGLRALVHGNYVTYYKQRTKEVVVLRVLHGARDHAAIAEEGGFEFES